MPANAWSQTRMLCDVATCIFNTWAVWLHFMFKHGSLGSKYLCPGALIIDGHNLKTNLFIAAAKVRNIFKITVCSAVY